VVALGLVGCGGGGGEKQSLDPVGEVKVQEKALRAALDRKDLVAFMGFYSDRFKDHEGTTKPELRQYLFVSQDDLSFTPLERVDTQYVVSSNHRRVSEFFVVAVHDVYHNPDTGLDEPYTSRYSGQVDWIAEGGAWRIIYERQASMAMVLTALRNH